MTDRPILFSGPMVRALLAGTKTQTRRIVKPQPHRDASRTFGLIDVIGGPRATWSFVDVNGVPVPWNESVPAGKIPGKRGPFRHIGRCPYGQPGDRLWVRETWGEDYTSYAYVTQGQHQTTIPTASTVYRADGHVMRENGTGWKPSIHMFRDRSRITLEITEVRVQRLQEISEEDAEAEGITLLNGFYPGSAHKIKGTPKVYPSATGAYCDLWESINGPGSWELNPWVWVLSFKRVPQ